MFLTVETSIPLFFAITSAFTKLTSCINEPNTPFKTAVSRGEVFNSASEPLNDISTDFKLPFASCFENSPKFSANNM